MSDKPLVFISHITEESDFYQNSMRSSLGGFTGTTADYSAFRTERIFSNLHLGKHAEICVSPLNRTTRASPPPRPGFGDPG
jgi:hypothetical protein